MPEAAEAMLRAKDDRFFGVLTVAQLISLGIVAFGVAGLVKMRGAQASETGEA